MIGIPSREGLLSTSQISCEKERCAVCVCISVCLCLCIICMVCLYIMYMCVSMVYTSL